MKMLIKKVYYCDFCKKRRMQKGAMESHERHCTANPNRYCRVCDDWTSVESFQEILKKYKALHDKITKNSGNRELTENEANDLSCAVDGCPVCMLSVLRLCGLSAYENFDYQKEMTAYWKEHNAQNADCYY